MIYEKNEMETRNCISKEILRMITSNFLKTLGSFQNRMQKETMYEFYVRHHATPEILELVSLENRQFGTMMENIIKEVFHLEKSTRTTYDGMLVNASMKLRIEIKSSRYWRSSKHVFFKWQHIMRDHDYHVLLLCGLDFHGIRVYAISKQNFMRLLDQNIVRQQGGAEGQGIWATSHEIGAYLTEICSGNDWFEFVKNIHIL